MYTGNKSLDAIIAQMSVTKVGEGYIDAQWRGKLTVAQDRAIAKFIESQPKNFTKDTNTGLALTLVVFDVIEGNRWKSRTISVAPHKEHIVVSLTDNDRELTPEELASI